MELGMFILELGLGLWGTLHTDEEEQGISIKDTLSILQTMYEEQTR